MLASLCSSNSSCAKDARCTGTLTKPISQKCLLSISTLLWQSFELHAIGDAMVLEQLEERKCTEMSYSLEGYFWA